MLDNKPHPNVF